MDFLAVIVKSPQHSGYEIITVHRSAILEWEKLERSLNKEGIIDDRLCYFNKSIESYPDLNRY